MTKAEGDHPACSYCPSEDGCGNAEVCRIMCMSDEEIIATTPDAEAVAAEMREIIREALRGQRCLTCGEVLTVGRSCEACAEKADLLNAFLKGDA